PDPDQLAAFIFVREQGRRRSIFFNHLALSDPATPEDRDRLRTRLRELADTAEKGDPQQNRIDALLNRLDYHIKRLVEGGPDAMASWDEACHDAKQIARCVRDLHEANLAPEDDRLADRLAPVLDHFPDETPDLLTRALDAAESVAASPDDDLDTAETDSEEDAGEDIGERSA
ncbi:MAG: hypothetical protein AAGK78_14085, partial [Planctomycetota bacterium]